MNDDLHMKDEDWRSRLTPEQYHVCREKGTEPPFSGAYCNCKDEGIYRCICCGQALFNSKAKYDSGTGWPSFWAPAEDDSINTESDDSLGMRRVEVTCNGCGAHLGHVFDDGPQPTRQRFCINSVSLDFYKEP